MRIQSNKRVKKDDGFSDGKLNDGFSEKDTRPFLESLVKRKISFKDVVMGEKNGDGVGVKPLDMTEGEVEKRCLRSQWTNAFIIKLLGHTVGYNYLVRRLNVLWQIKFGMDVIDVGWYPNFDPSSFKVSKLEVWVRFPNLPLEYFNEQVLMKIGRRIGRPLKVDTTTLSALRGRYARMCMEVDLEKPLLSTFQLRRRVHIIEYETLDLVCLSCGKYGHRKDDYKTGDA
ncbi:hypothetical protein DITRI_Ditri07aG0027100 [Diplodiscus trichospermus]